MTNQVYIDDVRLVTRAKRPDGSQALLLEVFSTTCGPCKQQVPHLAALAAKYPTVTVISCTWDSEDEVRSMIQQFPDMAKYNCGVVTGQRIRALMNEHGVRGVPHAFIFTESGALAWQGHPASCDSEIAKVAGASVRAFTGKGRVL